MCTFTISTKTRHHIDYMEFSHVLVTQHSSNYTYNLHTYTNTVNLLIQQKMQEWIQVVICSQEFATGTTYIPFTLTFPDHSAFQLRSHYYLRREIRNSFRREIHNSLREICTYLLIVATNFSNFSNCKKSHYR